MKKSARYLCLAALTGAAAICLTGCGKVKKDYDVYFFNQKSEIAESLESHRIILLPLFCLLQINKIRQ